MELALVQPPPPPRYIVFDLSGAGLRCFGPPSPAAEHIGVPFGTQAMGLEALRRTRMSRADLATNLWPIQVGTVMADTTDPDTTVSEAGTSGVQVAAEESEDDEVDSFDAFLCQETFARKIQALAELVGIKEGAYEPVDVLSEVVRVLQSIDTESDGVFPMSDTGGT